MLILSAGGCSDRGTAEKRLINDLPYLADRYIKNEFARQIKLNTHCKAWLIDGSKLLLLVFDGIDVVRREAAGNDLHEFALARYYTGQELDIKCNKASWSELTAVKHTRFSYRALATFDFTDTRRMWQRVPGCAIAMIALKSKTSEEQIRIDLLNKAARYLPDGKFDFNMVYKRQAMSSGRNFTVSFFVCYDPDIPGWVPEDPELAGRIELNAAVPDWRSCTPDKFTPAAEGMKLYKNDFYWNNTHIIRQKHDAGLVCCNGQWMPPAQAEATRKLEELVKRFDPVAANVDMLTAFLQALKAFPPEMDFSEALQKAVLCAEKNISDMRKKDDWQQLENFYSLMQENPLFSEVIARTKTTAVEAIKAVKQRVNRQIELAVDGINSSLQTLKNLGRKDDLTAMQINIECVRQENILKKLCPQDEKVIAADILKLRFCLLLKKRDTNAVNMRYITTDARGIFRDLEEKMFSKCRSCSNGRQRCFYCEDNPGYCRSCKGKANAGGKECATCSGRRFCVHCKGRAFMICMKCGGRGVVILSSDIEKLYLQTFAELEQLLLENVAEWEKKRLPL